MFRACRTAAIATTVALLALSPATRHTAMGASTTPSTGSASMVSHARSSAMSAMTAKTSATPTAVGPRTYYLALGDSLAFGYQPDLQFYQGYADDFYAQLLPFGTLSLINMACPGETSTTFISGGCPYSFLRKYPYQGAQLAAALAFIASHPGQVSPVTLDIGANDLLPLIDTTHCTIASSYRQVLAAADANIRSVLAQLGAALRGSGDLFMMNYYFPYQNLCPNLVPVIRQLNAHLAADAAAYTVPLARVFGAFGGPGTPNPHLCSYTWMCSPFQDIHATSAGYAVIARAFEQTAGY